MKSVCLLANAALSRVTYRQIRCSSLHKKDPTNILRSRNLSSTYLVWCMSNTIKKKPTGPPPRPAAFPLFWFSLWFNYSLNSAASNSICSTRRLMLCIILKVYDCSVQVAYTLISDSQRWAATVGFFWQSKASNEDHLFPVAASFFNYSSGSLRSKSAILKSFSEPSPSANFQLLSQRLPTLFAGRQHPYSLSLQLRTSHLVKHSGRKSSLQGWTFTENRSGRYL